LTPGLVSSHFLKHAYNSTRCLEACTEEELRNGRKLTKLRPDVFMKAKRILVGGLKNGELLAIAQDLADGGKRFSTKGSSSQACLRRSTLIKSHSSKSDFAPRESRLMSTASIPNMSNRRNSFRGAATFESNISKVVESPRGTEVPQDVAHTRTSSAGSHRSLKTSGDDGSPSRRTSGGPARRISAQEKRGAAHQPSVQPSARGSVQRRNSSSGPIPLPASPAASPDPPPVEKPKPKPTENAATKVVGPEPWASVVTAARAQLEKEKNQPHHAHLPSSTTLHSVKPDPSKPKQKVVLSKFGVGAFTETVVRIAFTYLTTYGNNSQMSSGAYVRAVWFIAYLRCVFSNLSHSLESRTGEHPKGGISGDLPDCSKNESSQLQPKPSHQKPKADAEELVHGALQKALLDIRKEFWEMPPQLIQDLLPEIRIRAGMPETAVSDALAIQKRRRSLSGPNSTEAVEEAVGRNPSKSSSQGRLSSSRASSPAPTELLKMLQPLGKGGESSAGDKHKRRPSRMMKLPTAGNLTTPAGDLDSPKTVKRKQQPSIKGGVCTLCNGSAQTGEWGNPRCHGCSIVDRLPFKNHLFRTMLLHQPRQNLKGWIAETPLRTRKHLLTPPPMGRSHALRRVPERKRAVVTEAA